MARLDAQRPPSKYQRPSAKKAARGYDVPLHTPWGTEGVAGDVASTGATAGVNGAWTPSGSTPPETVAALIAGTPKTVTPSVTSAWTATYYVQTQTAGVPGRAHWNGTAWVAGAAA
jgi:hypothetical protein